MPKGGDKDCDATISAEAYSKINLHAAKYASELMCGFLIGTVNATGEVQVDDVLPICHSNPVGPIFEVAGGMCESFFPTKDVVGLYYTSDDGEYGNDDTTPYFVDKVCDTIKLNCKDKDKMSCLILTVVTNKINPNPSRTGDEDTADAELAAVDDANDSDNTSQILCLNAYMTINTNNDHSNSLSSSNKKKNIGTRERTASFHSSKVSLGPIKGSTCKQLNNILDSMLIGGKQITIEDVQSHMQNGPGSSPAGEISCKNTHINLECGLLKKDLNK
jgi:hypothetical protein